MFAWNQNISPSTSPVIWAQKAFLGEFLGFFVFPLFGRGRSLATFPVARYRQTQKDLRNAKQPKMSSLGNLASILSMSL